MKDSAQCPIAACDSKGHMTSKHIKHTLAYECPLFHNLTTSQCKRILNIRGDVVTCRKRPREYYDATLDWHLDEKSLEMQRTDQSGYAREPLLECHSSANTLLFFRKAQVQICNHPSFVERKSQEIVDRIEGQSGVRQIQIGDWLLDVQYEAPLPANVASNQLVFVCEQCFKLIVDLYAYERHQSKCTSTNPPGTEIYRKDSISVFEVDGNKARMYCQNLCLVGKLLIAHKTLLYDVAPFSFYILTEVDGLGGCHFLGYFSKEKCSELNYNLSCILVMPHRQGSGYGRFLIELSYALTRQEGTTGTPEKPISDLGLIAYRSYWRAKLIEYFDGRGKSRQMSMNDIATKTGISVKDLITTLEEMKLIKCVREEKRIILCSEFKLEKFRRPKPKLYFDERYLKIVDN